MPVSVTKIPLEIVEIKNDGYHCFVNILINDVVPARLILDTGASRTILDYKFAEQAGWLNQMEENEEKASGLGTNSMQGFTLILESLKIGELTIPNYLTGILDIQHVNETYSQIGLPAINGAIGSDILYDYKSVINYKIKMLTLSLKKN